MIQFTEVSKVYPGRQEALRQISLHLPRGEMAFLTGHSGAGKSTLLKLIGLIERHSRGQIVIDGQNLERIKPRHIPYYRRKIGFIFQSFNLIPDLDVFDNVDVPLRYRGMNAQERKKRISEALEVVGLAHGGERELQRWFMRLC